MLPRLTSAASPGTVAVTEVLSERLEGWLFRVPPSSLKAGRGVVGGNHSLTGVDTV